MNEAGHIRRGVLEAIVRSALNVDTLMLRLAQVSWSAIDYLNTVRAWRDEASRRDDELRTALGDGLFEDRQRDLNTQVAAIEH